jgi:acyl-CoA thioesterase FadM
MGHDAVTVQVRAGDCDSNGHVNNAVYVAYVEHALAGRLAALGLMADWRGDGSHAWRLDSLSVEYRQAARFGDRLDTLLWLEVADPLRPVFACELTRPDPDGAPASVVRSRSCWQRFRRSTGEAEPVPQVVLDSFPAGAGTSVRTFQLPPDCPACRTYVWEHRVMRAELNPQGAAHPEAIYHWLEDAVFEASAEAGWPVERWLGVGMLTLQTRHDTRFHTYPRRGEAIRIASRLVDVRHWRGTWQVEVRRALDGELLVRDYSTGTFLNLEGRPTTPPPEMMQEIQFGRRPGS